MKERAVRGVDWREGPSDWQLVVEGIEALGEVERTMEAECRCGLVWDEAAHYCPCWLGFHGAGDVMIRTEKAGFTGRT